MFSVGRCNRVFRCKLTEKSTKAQKDLLIRLYGTEYSTQVETNREKEVLVCYIASQHEIGPRILGIFQGGRIEEFIPVSSEPLTVVSYMRVSNASSLVRLLPVKFTLFLCKLNKVHEVNNTVNEYSSSTS